MINTLSYNQIIKPYTMVTNIWIKIFVTRWSWK